MPRIWKDRIVEKPRTFIIQDNPDGTKTLIPSQGIITEAGTPVNAANLNGIEADLTSVTNKVVTPTEETINTNLASITSMSDAVSGVGKLEKIEGRSIVNLLGDAGNCEVLWSVNGGVVDTTIKLFNTGSFKFSPNNGQSFVHKNLLCDQTHKYFFSAYAYVSGYTSGIPPYMTLADYNTFTNYSSVAFDITKLNQWQRKSQIVTGKNGGGFKVLLGALGASTSIFNIDGVMIYDLTSIYGAGNEPTDIARLEREFPYIEGLQSVTPTVANSIGKNLLDKRKVTVGEISKGKPNTGINYVSDFISVKPNAKYVYSGNCLKADKETAFYDINKVYVDRWFGDTMTIPSNVCFVRIEVEPTVPIDSAILQLEEGTSATDYEPYKSSQLILPSGVIGNLKSLPNGVKDELDLVNKKLIRRVGEVILEGSENWTKTGVDGTNTLLFQMIQSDVKGLRHLSDRFITNIVNELWSTDSEGITGTSVGTSIRIRIFKSRLTTPDVSGFKAWLQANPTKVYYELATPSEVGVNINSVFGSYLNGTLMVDSDIPCNVIFSYPTNISGAMKGISEAYTNPNDRINNDLLGSTIYNTSAIPIFTNGTVTGLNHKNLTSDITIRTDAFDYSIPNFIIETRTLNTGETITFRYNLTTLEVEVM